MVQFLPEVERLTEIFSQATAPTFFLGAVAGFVSLMTARLSSVVDRMRTLNKMGADHPMLPLRQREIERLRRRARLLGQGIFASLVGGICSTVLLMILFLTELIGYRHAYGAALLFIIATVALGIGLIRFAQEARAGISEADEHD